MMTARPAEPTADRTLGDVATPIADRPIKDPSGAGAGRRVTAMLPTVQGGQAGLAPADPVVEDEPFSAQLARVRAQPRASTRPEGEITADCLTWLNSQPRTKARKVHQGAMTGGGEPDIDACARGRAVKIEVKRPGQVPTGRQLRRMEEWQRAGALVGWVTSLADLQAIMAHVGNPEFRNPLTGPGTDIAPPGR
jgi:hypothetical protein